MLNQRCTVFIRKRLLIVDTLCVRLLREMASACTVDLDVQSGEGPDQTSLETRNKDNLSKRARKRLEKLQKYKEMKKTKKPTNKNPSPGFTAEFYKETEYYFENGLRKVYPYYYTFTTYAKFRWTNRTIIDVLSTEFRANTEKDYKSAIENGTVTVNGHTVTADYILKNNDLIANHVHRHENPVLATPIEVLAHDDDILVINKPSSIPCHPCGQYRHNSIVFILGKELGCVNLTNIYRLDRLTSGVLIMGKSPKKTRELESQIVQRKVQKHYVCRVVGNFPDGIIEVNEPLGCLSEKVGLFRTKAGGKESHTTFEKINFNGKSSVVKCMPHTGRTHQIRIHLQFLGHPIVNDPFYNSDAWGKERGKGGVYDTSEEEIVKKIMSKHYMGIWEDGENPFFHERLQEIKDSIRNSGDPQTLTENSHDHQKVEAEGTKPDGGDEPCCKKLCIDDSVCIKPGPDSDVHVQTGTQEVLKGSSDVNVKTDAKQECSDVCKIGVQTNAVGDFLEPDAVGDLPNSKNDSCNGSHVGDESRSRSDSSLGRTNDHVESGTKDDISDSNSITSKSNTTGLSEEVDVHVKSENYILDEQVAGEAITTGDTSVKSDLNVESNTKDDRSEMMGDAVDSGKTSRLSDANQSSPFCTDQPGFERLKWIPDENCERCKKKYIDPSPEELVLYLHALKYKGPNWEYTTSLPDWAKDDWNEG